MVESAALCLARAGTLVMPPDIDAALQARRIDPDCRVVLSGGDAALLLPRLQALLGAQGIEVACQPDLALEALVELQPI